LARIEKNTGSWTPPPKDLAKKSWLRRGVLCYGQQDPGANPKQEPEQVQENELKNKSFS
jgi:hypothetical protein